MTTGTGIDFGNIVATTDLAALIARELGPADRSGRWLCPFHSDGTPSLGLTPDRRRYKCFACGATGTAVDWIMHRDSVGVIEAARTLDPNAKPTNRPADRPRLTVVSPPPVEAPKPKPPWQDAGWQAAADDIVRRAESCLWSDGGKAAREWLHRRGFEDHTIRRFRLGFIPDRIASGIVEALGPNRYGKPQRLVADRGIVIPRLAPGSWYPSGEPEWSGVKIRRLMPDASAPWDKEQGAKFRALTGSVPGYLYPYDDPTPGVPCMVCEGEMDALIAFQEAGHIVSVATTSGATQGPMPEALAALRQCGEILIATDHDQAGEKAAVDWRARFPGHAKRLYLPSGKDITDFVVSGGNLAEWLRSELRRLA